MHKIVLLDYKACEPGMISSNTNQACFKQFETHVCITSTLATDALALKHRAISIQYVDDTHRVGDKMEWLRFTFCYTGYVLSDHLAIYDLWAWW